nr:hypothetical protein [Nonomuraea mesophila]
MYGPSGSEPALSSTPVRRSPWPGDASAEKYRYHRLLIHCRSGAHMVQQPGPGLRVNTVCSAAVFRPAIVADLRMMILEDHVVAT